MDFSVVSWNVNSVNARLDRLVGFLQRTSPDVVCLQELKCEEGKFPYDAMKALGYSYYIRGQRTYNGVAVLSKIPGQIVSKGLGSTEFDHEARLITVDIAGFRISSVYVPNGQDIGTDRYVHKLKWLYALKKFYMEGPDGPKRHIIAGDFNVALEDRDVYDPIALSNQLLFSLPERQALSDFLSIGLVDTFRLHQQAGGFYSWWDYRALSFPMGKGMRIDYVFCSADLAGSCVAAEIERNERKGEKPSDHAPVRSVFKKL